MEARCRHVCQQRIGELVLLAALGQHLWVALGARLGGGMRLESRQQSVSRLSRVRVGSAGNEGRKCAVVTRALGGRLPVGAVRGGEGGKPAAAPVPSTAAASATAREAGGEGRAAEPDGCARKGAAGPAGVCGDASVVRLWADRTGSVSAPAVASATSSARAAVNRRSGMGRLPYKVHRSEQAQFLPLQVKFSLLGRAFG